MEKASIILSILIHNDDFMMIFWGILGMIVMLWEPFFIRSKALSEEELVEIDPKFKHIKADYGSFSIVAAILTVFLLMVIWSPLENWAIANYGRKFYPLLVFVCSAYAIYQGLFALRKDVYPRGRFLSFRYDDVTVIHRHATYQIMSSIVLSVVAVLFFLATSSKIQ